MSGDHDLYDKFQSLQLFVTTEYPCSYLPGRKARNLVADPEITDAALYNQLAVLGFRRSGDHVYRPHCRGCDECRSLRIPVEAFRPNRAQQRTWRKNQDLTTRVLTVQFYPEHYQLFMRYVQHRHQGGGMDDSDEFDYEHFIQTGWCTTYLCEFRCQQRLVAVAVIDQLADGLSAVYTFFEPEEAARSLGTYAILWEIDETRRLHLPWLYLGYWVQNSAKMSYKSKFKPHQLFIRGHWVTVGAV